MFIAYFERTISRLLLTIIVGVLPFMGGCSEDDNPVTDDHDHEEMAPMHADADGFVLKVDGDQVYRQFQESHEGGLTVAAGKEIDVDVSFLDDHGHEFHPGEDQEEDDGHDHENEAGEAYTLGLSEYDDKIIDIHLGEDDGHAHADDEDAGLSFGVEGLSAGETEIKLQLIHGDHADYTAPFLIPVTVE